MFKNFTITVAAIGALLLGACGAASDTPDVTVANNATATKAGNAAMADGDDLSALRERFPSLKPDAIKPSQVDGWYEVVSANRKILYVSRDGNFALDGNLFDLNSGINLTENYYNSERQQLMSQVSSDDMIVFPAKQTKHSITVFTDIDCGYCRKLHQEMNELNDLGIEVRYMFFPRSGPGTASWDKATTVYCSDDRNTALTRAKNNERLAPLQCGESGMIQAQYDLGRQVGLNGTPAIVTANGELIAGYLPAKSLLSRLDRSASLAGVNKVSATK